MRIKELNRSIKTVRRRSIEISKISKLNNELISLVSVFKGLDLLGREDNQKGNTLHQQHSLSLMLSHVSLRLALLPESISFQATKYCPQASKPH